MRLRIAHRTVYRFDAPVLRVLQSHRLEPSDFAGQRIIDWRVVTEGAVVGTAFRDAAGDVTRTVSLRGPLTEVAVAVEGEVETTDLQGVLRGHREQVRPDVYLRSTRATRSDVALNDLAHGAIAGIGRQDALGVAHALSSAVSAAIAYMPGTTGTATTAAETLAQGKGVCQDQSHLLIAMALCLDIPARYVAGYMLAAPPGDGATEQPEASHAWAELHVDGLGWVGFDPVNRCCPDERYVRLCSGYDAPDAAPIRGLTVGGGGEDLDVTVAVAAVQQ